MYVSREGRKKAEEEGVPQGSLKSRDAGSGVDD
jgi:hypothetical protein